MSLLEFPNLYYPPPKRRDRVSLREVMEYKCDGLDEYTRNTRFQWFLKQCVLGKIALYQINWPVYYMPKIDDDSISVSWGFIKFRGSDGTHDFPYDVNNREATSFGAGQSKH